MRKTQKPVKLMNHKSSTNRHQINKKKKKRVWNGKEMKWNVNSMGVILWVYHQMECEFYERDIMGLSSRVYHQMECEYYECDIDYGLYPVYQMK